MTRSKSSTIKSKMFFSISTMSSAIILVLLISTSAIFYSWFVSLETSSTIQQLNYISKQLEAYLTSIDNYSKSIIVDAEIQKKVIKYNDASERFTGIDQMDIKQRINQIIPSVPYIHSVALYAPDKTLIASTAIYYHSNSIADITIENDSLWITNYQYSNQNRSKEIMVLSYIRPFYNIATGSLIGYIDISMPEDNIAGIYRDHAADFRNIFIINQEGIVQSSDGFVALMSSYEDFDRAIISGKDHHKILNSSILFSSYFSRLDWYIMNVVDLNTFLQPIHKIFALSLGIAFLCILLSFGISRTLSKTITLPIYHLISHIQKVKSGDWTPLDRKLHDGDIGALYVEFNSMISAQKRLKDDLLKSQKLKNKLSLDLLQQQVNPHFLYNTLDNIYSLAELEENEILKDIVINLSAFYRKSLSNGQFYITIKEELKIIRAYLLIMQIRYFNKFDFVIDCPDDLLHYRCLKFLLQPIVENSIYHGIKEIPNHGLLEILVRKKEEQILFTVRDNGVGIRPETLKTIWKTESDHFGIKNIHQRVQLYYGSNYGLSISNCPNAGCITTITIALKIPKEINDEA